jgi:hypothetical protein
VELLHRHRSLFVLLNGLIILSFAIPALVIPERHWGMLGLTATDPYLARVTAWYLLAFGIAALLAARAPERHPIVVALIGIEKLGPTTAFFVRLVTVGFNAPLAIVCASDAVLSVVLIRYALWLRAREHRA